MDKYPAFAGAIPLDVDILKPQRATEIALGFVLQAAFGTGTVIDGLTVTQTVSPSMGVLVGPGSIIVATTVDTVVAGFGSLPVNTSPLVKVGINLTPTTLTTLTAPGTAGQSQNTLVEAQFLEVDGSPVVLPYYNSANPSIPFTGPANAGTPNNTARTNTVQLQYKQGAAAATGSQLTPAPDAGWTGVAVITIANGQSSVLNANITRYVNAPIVPTKLPALRIKLTGNLTLFVAAAGNDLNSGLSAAVPFATMQAAWNSIVNNYDLAGFNVTISVGNGAYSSGVIVQGAPTGYGSGNTISFVGNVATPTNCAITTSNQHCFAIQGVSARVSGFSLATSGTVASLQFGPTAQVAVGLYVYQGAVCSIAGNMNFGTCSGAHIYAANGGYAEVDSGYSISGSATAHFQATGSGAFINEGNGSYTITLSGTPAFSTAFANAGAQAQIQMPAGIVTFSGSATGPRYQTATNALINSGGGGANFFPGNVAGTGTNSGTTPFGLYV